MREERKILEGHADAAMFGIDLGHVFAADDDLAGIRLDDAGDEAQQHGLAGAGGAEEHEGLAVGDIERQVVEHGLALVALGDVLQLQRGHDYPFTAPSDRPSTR